MAKKTMTPPAEEYFTCHYLHDSVSAMKVASRNFAFLDQGGLDVFLAMFQKSWNSLYQSDLFYTKNGSLIDGQGKKYGIDRFLNEDFHKAYKPNRSIAFCEVSDNFKTNLELFRKLRNQSVHENLHQGYNYEHMETFLNPYTRAAFNNYLNFYSKLYSDFINNVYASGGSCRPDLMSHKCTAFKLPSKEQLSKHLKIAVSIYTTKSRNELRESDRGLYAVNISRSLKTEIKRLLRHDNEQERKAMESVNQELVFQLSNGGGSEQGIQHMGAYPHYAHNIASLLEHDERCRYKLGSQHISRICQTQGILKFNNGKGYLAGAGFLHPTLDFTVREMIFIDRVNKRTKYSDHIVTYILSGLNGFGSTIEKGQEHEVAAAFVGVKPDTLKLKKHLADEKEESE